jgi:hypothetical protein
MSPTLYTEKGYRFFIWSKEETREHVHVVKEDVSCKYWLSPKIALAFNKGFKDKELNEIKKIIIENETIFKEKWKKFFG